MPDGTVIEIRDETANDIFFHGFRIALFEQGLRCFARSKARHPNLPIQFLIGLCEPLRDLFSRHLDLEGPLHRAEFRHFHFHLSRDFLCNVIGTPR